MNWREVIARLESGELDEYSDTKGTSNVYSIKSALLKQYPGLDIKTEPSSDGTSLITITAGSRA